VLYRLGQPLVIRIFVFIAVFAPFGGVTAVHEQKIAILRVFAAEEPLVLDEGVGIEQRLLCTRFALPEACEAALVINAFPFRVLERQVRLGERPEAN